MEQEAESPHSPLSPSRALSGKRSLECGSAGTARKHARTTGASLFSSTAAASAALSTCTAGLTPIRTSCSIDSSVSAALSFGGTLAAQAAEVVAMLAGTSNEAPGAAAAAALTTAAGCSSMEPLHQEELEEEPCTPRASSFSTSIFSPPHSNAQRTCSNATGGAAVTPSTAMLRHLASVTADAAGTSPNIAGTTACLDLPELSPHRAPHHASHHAFTRRVLSFNVWTGDAPEAAVIHPMNAPGAGVAGMPQVQAQAPGASNGGCWWLPSPATTPTAGSARGEAAPNPTFRAASPMRPAGYSPRLTGLGLSAYSPAATSNAMGVPDRMVTGRVALLRAPQSQQGRDSHSQMLQEAAAEVHAGRPRAFLAAAHQLLELALRTQHSGGSGAVAGGAQAQGPGEVPLGAALPWALPGRGLSTRTHPQQAASSTSVACVHAEQAPPDATQRPTAAVFAAAAATATHVHLGLPLLSISTVGATASGVGSAADALRSAVARQSPTGTLAITPGVWRLAGAKPAPANSGAPTTVSAISAAVSPPAAPSPAMRPRVEGLDDVEDVESPARRFPVAAHWEAAEAEPADSTPRAMPHAAAPAAAAAPHSTPHAPASGTPARRSFFSPTASSCGAVGGAADATPSWGMASPAGVSVAGGATLPEPARSAAASGGGSGGVPGSATPVSQLQRPSRFASVRINRTAQLRFVLASTLAGMADSDTSPPRAQDGNDPDATGTPGQEHAAATQATSQATSHAVSLASLVAPAAVERSTDAGLSPAAEAALDVDAARKAYPQLVARAFQDWLSLQPANSAPDDNASNQDAQPDN